MSRQLAPLVHPGDSPPPDGADSAFVKLHGTAARDESLLFTTPQIMKPLESGWRSALVKAAKGRLLFIVGYGGADVDLYPALQEAMSCASAVYWFEGTGADELETSEQAKYERWRFRLDSIQGDPESLPPDGRHLVWCGSGSTVNSPSEGLLRALEAGGDVSVIPSVKERLFIVKAEVAETETRGKDNPVGARLLMAAIFRERLRQRWGAALRHAGVLVVGSGNEKRRAAGALRNLVLLRAQPLRAAFNWLYRRVAWNKSHRDFASFQAGSVEHDPELAARILEGSKSDVDIDQAINVAATGRWSGALGISEEIARRQFDVALNRTGVDDSRDWPERVSYSAFEVAQSLLWQGRFYEADDICRAGYMRVSGSKWVAWELAIRAAVRFVHAEYKVASEQLATAIEILDLEGFADFTLQLWVERAACARLQGERTEAWEHLQRSIRHPRKKVGTLAAILAEQAEQCFSDGATAEAEKLWMQLASSQLPLWRGIGFLRLSETGHSAKQNATAAADAFEAIGSRWGTLRTAALVGRLTPAELLEQTSTLGPVDVFRPNGPWIT